MNVRLTEKEIDGIVTAMKSLIHNMSAKLYLHGSRTKLNERGGDIDLLLVFQLDENKLKISEIKHHLLAKIKEQIGDQKIDLLITSEAQIKNDEFVKIILPSAVLLYDF